MGHSPHFINDPGDPIEAFVMSDPPWIEPYLFAVTDDDKTHVNILCLSTGIEDGLYFELLLPSYSMDALYSPNSYYWTFQDYGDPTTVSSWYNYQLELFHECGSVMIDLGTSAFYINSSLIPDNYQWQRNGSGNVIFSGGYSIKVYGGLNVNGTSSNRVTIDGGSGIKTYSGSNVNINYAEIKNATYGVYVDNASPTITNCLIQNNTFGVYALNYASPTLSRNTIRNNSSWGIYGLIHGYQHNGNRPQYRIKSLYICIWKNKISENSQVKKDLAIASEQ